MPGHGSTDGQQRGHGRNTGDDDDFTFLGFLFRGHGLVMNGRVFHNDGYLILLIAFAGLDIIGNAIRSDQCRIGGFDLRIVFDDDVRRRHRVVKREIG